MRKRAAAAPPVLETGIYGSWHSSSQDLEKLLEHGDDDTVHAIVAAAGLSEPGVVEFVDSATSAQLTESILDMARPRLEAIGVEVAKAIDVRCDSGHDDTEAGSGSESAIPQAAAPDKVIPCKLSVGYQSHM